MKTYIFVLSFLCMSFLVHAQTINVKEEMGKVLKQYELLLKAHPDTKKTPHSFSNGKYINMPAEWWCSGFFGASLWKLYEYTKNTKWKNAAHLWSMAVRKGQYNTTTHDLGFMIYYPFGHGYRLTGNPLYKSILLNGAKSLATRFDPRVGVIKSWDSFKDTYNYPVIIDNMMNLDYLFWATKETKDPAYYNIAVKHADATIKNHFRPDFSSYHVVCYDSAGNVLVKQTWQGANDSSAWARGQAWGLYGFTSMYSDTRDKKYLQQAIAIADFYIYHPNLPKDKIPYWDFNAPNIPYEERDVSAGAIACSALLELCRYTSKKKTQEYFTVAKQMLQSLSSHAYRNALGENGNFLLKHSVGFKPGGKEIDVPLVYADYYYIEALMRYNKLVKSKKFPE